MSDLGYQNDAQSGLSPHENSLDSYVAALTNAVNQPYPPYAELGTKRDGEWIQLSTPTCCRSRTSTTRRSARSA
jgi:glutamate--cysteine ligase